MDDDNIDTQVSSRSANGERTFNLMDDDRLQDEAFTKMIKSEEGDEFLDAMSHLNLSNSEISSDETYTISSYHSTDADDDRIEFTANSCHRKKRKMLKKQGGRVDGESEPEEETLNIGSIGNCDSVSSTQISMTATLGSEIRKSEGGKLEEKTRLYGTATAIASESNSAREQRPPLDNEQLQHPTSLEVPSEAALSTAEPLVGIDFNSSSAMQKTPCATIDDNEKVVEEVVRALIQFVDMQIMTKRDLLVGAKPTAESTCFERLKMNNSSLHEGCRDQNSEPKSVVLDGTSQISSMTLESMKVPSDAIMGLSVTSPKLSSECPSQSLKGDEKLSKVTDKAAAFETPKRLPATIDSRTITRPGKTRTQQQQLPEAVVAPLTKTIADPAAESKNTVLEAVVRSSNVQSGKASCVSNEVPGVEILQPQFTASPSDAIARAGVEPPETNTSVVAKLALPHSAANADAAKKQDHSRREEQRPAQRTRQRTVTMQSQVSLDITAAYNEVRQMDVSDPLVEFHRRVQSLVSSKERDWTAKAEKLSQLLAHETKRNEPLEQKAAERLLAIGEYEKLVKDFIEELKMKSNGARNSDITNDSKLIGGPGPERTLSSDDIFILIKERDQLAEEVNSLEMSYGELFRRYEKLRQTSVEIKQNEERVKATSEEMAKRYSILAEKFEMLRKNAEEQLDMANNEIEQLIKQHESDTLGLRLKVKQLESKNNSLISSLEAKKMEIENMTAIFEEVINKAEANDDNAATLS